MGNGPARLDPALSYACGRLRVETKATACVSRPGASLDECAAVARALPDYSYLARQQTACARDRRDSMHYRPNYPQSHVRDAPCHSLVLRA